MTTLANATTNSDNSVYAELGLKLGPRKVAAMARRLGIRTRVSHNAANSLGGLKEGVTPLDMAHAYETFAQRGELTYGTLSPGDPDDRKVTPIPGPVGIEAIGRGAKDDFKPLEIGGAKLENRKRTRRVLSPGIADQVGAILQTVVKSGTATRAFVPGVTVAGKTGTTEGYGDAWFVGWTKEYTVAIWVGYPDQLQADGDRVPGRPGGRRHLPGGDLQDVRRRARGPQEGQEGHDRDRAGRAARQLDRRRLRRPDARPTRASAIEGGGAPPASTPVPQQEAPAAARARAGRRRPSRRPSSRRRPPPEQPAEPAPETGRGRSPRPARASAQPRASAAAARRCASPARRTATAARPPW